MKKIIALLFCFALFLGCGANKDSVASQHGYNHKIINVGEHKIAIIWHTLRAGFAAVKLND